MEKWGEKSVDNVTKPNQAAQTLALNVLSWLLGQDELIGAFLNASGAQPQDMAALAQTPMFQGAVLDFLMEDDSRIMAFCDAHSMPYTAIQTARAALPGAQYTHWT